MLNATQLVWGGWGGGMITFLALVHMLNATQLVWGGWGWGMITFLALVHMFNATQLVWGGWGGGMITFLCTCTHVECYATWLERFLRTQCFFKKQRERSESSLENLCLCLYVPTKCGQCMAWDWTTVQRMTTKQKKVSRSECFPQNWHGTVAKRRFRFKALRFTAFWIPPF